MTEKIIVLTLAGVEVRRIKTDALDIGITLMEREGTRMRTIARLETHHPGLPKRAQITFRKTAAAAWLDIYSDGLICWPPVPRQSGPEVKNG